MLDQAHRRSDGAAAGPTTAIAWLLGGILAILLGAALMRLSSVAIPVTMGLLLALVLAPLDRWACRKLPDPLRWLGRLLSLFVMLAALALFAGGLVYCAQVLVAQGPQIGTDLDRFLTLDDRVADRLPDTLSGMLDQTGGALSTRLTETAVGVAREVTGTVSTFLATLVLVVFLALLALGETRLWRHKADGPEEGGQEGWSRVAQAVSARLRLFLALRAAMGALQALLYAGWLWWFGLDLLPVWAVLTFLLTFIPNIGSMIAGTLPVAYALLTKDPATALAVAAGLFAIEQVVGNFIDPKLQGREVAVSPLVVLGMVLLWGGLWGIAGAFLAVPLTIVAIGVFAHLPALRGVAVFLSTMPDEAALREALDV